MTCKGAYDDRSAEEGIVGHGHKHKLAHQLLCHTYRSSAVD